MSTPSAADQPTSGRGRGYSRGWRLFTVILLRPLLRLLVRHEWQGRQNFPRAGGVILAPNHPPVDLSRYAGQQPSAGTLRAATADIMAGITALLAGLRQQAPPAVPYDPAASGEDPSSRTDGGSPPASCATPAGEAPLTSPAGQA
jgi:hypothetical protein